MSGNISSEQMLANIFVGEAIAAANLLLSECSGIKVPDEIIEVVNETKEIADTTASYNTLSGDILSDLNWRMHIICSKLYLNIQRVARDKRGRFSSVISAYKNMMFHFSKGQMQLVPMEHEQLLLDMGHHAKILNDSTQNEINRLIASGFTQRELTELFIEIDDISTRLMKHLDENNPFIGINEISTSLDIFTDKLKQTANLIGEPGDTLIYLADEYGFFTNKINELSIQ